MEKVLKKIQEIENGRISIIAFSTKEERFLDSLNCDLTVPLASAAKVAVGFAVAKYVEEGLMGWETLIENIAFNPAEDSEVLYPHFQQRNSLTLGEAVEVMIACHDSFVAKCIVRSCGGWDKINRTIQAEFPLIHVTENPRDPGNRGRIDQALNLLVHILQEYKNRPQKWVPLINGLVRQQGEIDDIPSHHLNHMTGGLENAVVDIGVLGNFNDNPIVFALGAVDLPDRNENSEADLKIGEALRLLYDYFKNQ